MTTNKPLLYLGDLQGPEGNAYAVLGAAQRVAKENEMDWPAIHQEATSGDYEHLLATLKEHFEVHVFAAVQTRQL